MKAPLILSSAIKKSGLVAAFLPLAFVVYPHATHAALAAQNSGENALVFKINPKPKTNQQLNIASEPEINPTLVNPCYPAPADSCNPDTSPAQQWTVQPVAVAPEKPTVEPAQKSYSKEEVQQLIIEYSAQFGIDPTTPLCIARLESGYNQHSKNRRSTASGVFQYLTSTWRHTDEGKVGLSVFDADANVKAAVKYMAIHKSTQPWTVRGKCPQLAFLK